MNIAELLASNTLVLVFCVTILGLLVGSFLNVVVYRLPIMMQRDWQSQAREVLELENEEPGERFNLLLPDSSCPHCGHQIRAWENIPIVSWLLLRGRCSGCKAPISKRYPLVELTCGVLSGYVA
ncbi:MAG: prepilin peptidase, partial [Pseudomonas sp.]|nr:prepilin peptidase [Pseudomonas sp.]